MTTAGRQLVQWLDELGRISDEKGRLTRTFLSPAMRRANATVGAWMRAAGLSVRTDMWGNLIGRSAGAPAETKTLLLGSHLDTVRDAGRFDGALGVLLPVVALIELRRRRVVLPFNVEVLGFSEEEGVRFANAYLGSKGYSGQTSAADLARCDAGGVSVRQAIADWNAFSPLRAGSASRARPKVRRAGHARELLPRHHSGNVIGYVEVHIEQGPVLEAEKLAVGVVSAIAGQTRGRLVFLGKAGHAGTTPMALRRDALAGAAEFMVAAEGLARESPPLVATVGTLEVKPGAGNVIPGEATLSLDVRHPHNPGRRAALWILIATARQIARRRRLSVKWEPTQDNGAVTCAPALTARLNASVLTQQKRSLSLVSGAGHDAVVMSAMTPVAMLFVRCRDGLSHHPDEYASPADLDLALRVMMDFLEKLAQDYRT